MRIAATACVCVLASLGCGSSQTGSGNEDAGETTAASGSVGSESSTDETGEQPMDCGSITLQPEYIPPLVMFVVDSSSSMLASWDHDGDLQTPEQTRWASARELVELTTGVMGDSVLGLQRFPSADACAGSPSCADASACAVAPMPEVALAEQPGAVLLAALPGPNPEPQELAGASPAAAAYQSALAQALAYRDEHSFAYVVLLTDGRSNCGVDLEAPDNFAVYDEQLRALVEQALIEHQIQTIVIAIDEAADPLLEGGLDSIPGFDPRPALHQLGLVGGHQYPDPTAAYYSASDPLTIAHAFEGPDVLFECVIDLSWNPPSPEQIPLVTWTIDGEPIPYVEPGACDDQDGWTWLDPGLIMTFCGQACEAMKHNEVLIEGRYGCPPSH